MTHVLVVDDQPEVRKLIQLVLEGSGYSVLTAGSGEEALTLFAQHNAEVSLLVTDILMPGMTGFELVERVLRRRPDLPILLMSGTETGDVPHAFLRKPFLLPELTASVGRALAENHAAHSCGRSAV